MRAFFPIPFPDLLRRMRREAEIRQSIFDLPARKWFAPEDGLDFSAWHFDRPVSTPVGPAAGPHTQLSQNIVLAWLAGSRIVELKTVQTNDELDIPRPCIHVPNVGFNVEWSQELRVSESLLEYAKAVYLIEVLNHTNAFGLLDGSVGRDTVFDISVGYDLAGIRSPRVTDFIQSMKDAAPVFDLLRDQLTGDLAEFRDLRLPEAISDCVTLSTFHGCPADEIEAIARYLIETMGLHTIIKLNPTLLGFERVRELLVERLGYSYLEPRQEAFEQDLQYEDGLEIFRRLRGVAERHGSQIGAKFTNTLVVTNSAEFFPTQPDPYMYVSGPPLHVISMTLMQRFREDLRFQIPISFSAGIDARNFPTAVACGMVPVTTCTDLLRQGGYGRLPSYLRSLSREMGRVGVTSREAYVIGARGRGSEAIEATLKNSSEGRKLWELEGQRLAAIADRDPDLLPLRLRSVAAAAGLDPDGVVQSAMWHAGRLNGRDIIPSLAEDVRYHSRSNQKSPRRIESQLALYDCINCDLCIAACPNDAIFAYDVPPDSAETEVLFPQPDGGIRREPGAGFAIVERHQLAVIHGACNECSNCEVYCPEEGAPFVIKERIFLNREDYDASAGQDGFFREGKTLYARLEGRELQLVPEHDDQRAAVTGDGLRLEFTWEPMELHGVGIASDAGPFDTGQLWRMKTVWNAIFHSATPNMVNPDPAGARRTT